MTPAIEIFAILHFWFDCPPTTPARYRRVWFNRHPEFDRQCAAFAPAYAQAAAHALDTWQTTAPGALALVLLLDQFPRNLFRQQPQAYATDAHARQVAKAAIAQGLDAQLPPVQRSFFYLPLEHSENLADQDQCVACFWPLRDHPELSHFYVYAEKHREVIRRFGRFPHRNQILNRPATPAETAFLQQPGARF